MRDFFGLAMKNGWNIEGSKEKDGPYYEMSWENYDGTRSQYQVHELPRFTAADGEEVWIQFRSEGGQRGWLYELWVDLLVFAFDDRYVVVERAKLQEWLEEHVEKDYVTLAHQALMKVYKKNDGSVWTLIKDYHLKALALGEMREAEVKYYA